jgi:hypothetical protein
VSHIAWSILPKRIYWRHGKLIYNIKEFVVIVTQTLENHWKSSWATNQLQGLREVHTSKKFNGTWKSNKIICEGRQQVQAKLLQVSTTTRPQGSCKCPTTHTNKWKSLGARSGLYEGCSRTSHLKFRSVSFVLLAVWDARCHARATHLWRGVVNANSYCNIFRKLRKVIQRKRPGLHCWRVLQKCVIILICNNLYFITLISHIALQKDMNKFFLLFNL